MKKSGKKNSSDTSYTILTGLAFVFGTFLLALCYNLFFLPNNIVVGGSSGVAIIVEALTGFSSQIFIYIASFILLIVCYIFLGMDELKRVIIGSLLYPLFITFTYPIANVLLSVLHFDEILVTVALASLLYGFANGVIYKYGFSTGGSDIIVKIMVKYLHLSEGNALIILNFFIILASSFVFGVNLATYSIIILIISSLLVDKLSIGISTAKKFMIYTADIDKMNRMIQKKFHAGYTVFPTVEGYSHVKGNMIMCVIRNRDVNYFKEKILDVDPEAFYVISDCYEVQGGIRRSNLPFIER